jgi:hypothetical protein
MNDLGLLLAWSALRATLFLVPATLVHLAASRRGPAAGAWSAALGLSLCLLLVLAPALPRPERPASREGSPDRPPSDRRRADDPGSAGHAGDSFDPAPAAGWWVLDLSRPIARWQGLWKRMERRATVPEVIRTWAGVAALASVAGTLLGLLRLGLGLRAVRRCTRRSRAIDDPEWEDLLNGLCDSLGIVRRVELRETPELAAPATAGWRRPVILLPDDWPSWDVPTRRAVLAHELAHVARLDYATDVIARLAVAVHFYHPLVHWLARRLWLQQEQVADAVGVRLGGGRVVYLLALSRLALRQEERLVCGPARAFLPPRGALIRRIDMLNDEARVAERPVTGTGRRLAAAGLCAVALGVGMIRGPLRGDDKAPPPAAVAPTVSVPRPGAIDWIHVGEKADGLLMVRPAALFRRLGKPGLVELADRTVGLEMAGIILSDCIGDLSQFLDDLKLPERLATRPRLSLADIEWLTCSVRFGTGHSKDPEEKLHSFMIYGVTVRTLAPIDWRGFLRKWGLSFAEVRSGQGTYYRLVNRKGAGPALNLAGHPSFYLPDDRTLVLDTERPIEALARRGRPEPPAFLSGPDWHEASKGVLAFALDNQGGAFSKRYDLGRPDDAIVMKFLDGVESWTLGVEDADSIGLHAAARCRDARATDRLAGEVQSRVDLAKKALTAFQLQQTGEAIDEWLLVVRMGRRFMQNLRTEVGPEKTVLKLHARDIGPYADIAALTEPDLKEADAQLAKELARARAKAEAKTRRR